jgi:hypothetical protein
MRLNYTQAYNVPQLSQDIYYSACKQTYISLSFVIGHIPIQSFRMRLATRSRRCIGSSSSNNGRFIHGRGSRHSGCLLRGRDGGRRLRVGHHLRHLYTRLHLIRSFLVFIVTIITGLFAVVGFLVNRVESGDNEQDKVQASCRHEVDNAHDEDTRIKGIADAVIHGLRVDAVDSGALDDGDKFIDVRGDIVQLHENTHSCKHTSVNSTLIYIYIYIMYE